MLKFLRVKPVLKFLIAGGIIAFLALYVLQINPQFMSGSNASSPKIQTKGSGVEVMIPGNNYWSRAVNNSPVRVGTKIKTDSKSSAVLTYPSGTQTRLDMNTEVTLKEFEANPQNIIVALTSGRVWSSVVRLLGKESYSTESPSAVATVRGTAYSHAILEGGFNQIIVTQSKVEVGCKEVKSSKTILQGKMITSDCQQALGEPLKTPQRLLEDTWVKHNQEEDREQEKILKKIKPNSGTENQDQDLTQSDEVGQEDENFEDDNESQNDTETEDESLKEDETKNNKPSSSRTPPGV